MKDLALILVLRLVVYTQPLLYIDGPVSAGSDSIKHQSAPQSPMLHHSAGSSAVVDSDKRSVIPCLQSATDAGDRGTHGAASGPPGGLVLHGHLDSQKEETAVGDGQRCTKQNANGKRSSGTGDSPAAFQNQGRMSYCR